MDSKIYMDLFISRNGQLGYPFHEMDNLLVHFAKWTISHLGHNIYIVKKHQKKKKKKKIRRASFGRFISLGLNSSLSSPTSEQVCKKGGGEASWFGLVNWFLLTN